MMEEALPFLKNKIEAKSPMIDECVVRFHRCVWGFVLGCLSCCFLTRFLYFLFTGYDSSQPANESTYQPTRQPDG